MLSKDGILSILDDLIAQGADFKFGGSFVALAAHGDAQYWLSRTVATLERFLPSSSYQFREAVSLAESSRRQGGFIRTDITALVGHLRFLRDAVANGTLGSFVNEVAAADFATFLQHAREYAGRGLKMEASVIASAVFEDTVKRLGQATGTADLSKLDNTISALAKNGVITGVEAKHFRYLAGIRNAALHASWDEFDLGAVNDMISGVDRLLDALAKLP